MPTVGIGGDGSSGSGCHCTGLIQPVDIPSCVGWYKSSSLTGLTDGNNISFWRDSSGSGNDLYQFAENYPTYRSNIINNFPIARFNNALLNTYYSPYPLSTSGLSIYSVYSTNNNHLQQ